MCLVFCVSFVRAVVLGCCGCSLFSRRTLCISRLWVKLHATPLRSHLYTYLLLFFSRGCVVFLVDVVPRVPCAGWDGLDVCTVQQVQVLRLLRLLGQHNQEASEEVNSVLSQVNNYRERGFPPRNCHGVLSLLYCVYGSHFVRFGVGRYLLFILLYVLVQVATFATRSREKTNATCRAIFLSRLLLSDCDSSCPTLPSFPCTAYRYSPYRIQMPCFGLKLLTLSLLNDCNSSCSPSNTSR